MEGGEAEKQKSQSMDDLLVPIIIVAFAVCAWLVYAFENSNWFSAFQQVLGWMTNPIIHYNSVQIEGVPAAFLATVEILLLGVTLTYLVMGREKDLSIKLLSAFGLGFGFTGLIAIFLGIFGVLFQLQLNTVILLLLAFFLPMLLYKKIVKEKVAVKPWLISKIQLRKPSLPKNFKFWFPACLAIAITIFLCFYHALATVITHWDALVYHATMAVFMYNDHAIPVIAGTSIGIQMSANFPPLFSALGAYYYIQIGSVQDIFLRAIPPVMGLLTILVTYKIGEIIAGKRYGLIAALLLTITPLFFRYSIFATSYSTLTFFCTGTVLFLLLAFTKRENKYWVSCGLFYGFALLTSYLAMYLAPFIILALVVYSAQDKKALRKNFLKISMLILPALLISSVWFLRNDILVGNPIYPNAYTILGGINIDPLIENATFNQIKWSATLSFFGGQVSPIQSTMIFLTYRINFPAISLLTILGLALLPTQNKKFWLISAWPVLLGLFILSGISWGFPRHIVYALPGFALISALPIMTVLEKCKKIDAKDYKDKLLQIGNRLPSIRKTNIIRASLVILLFVAFLFPSLTLNMAGKINMESLNDQVPDDYLYFLENPNGDLRLALNVSYPEAVAWQFMNEHLSPGEKFASIENRIYYIKNCSNDYFFYLDGWEARELYNITDPTLMIQFLQKENVKYVVDVLWAKIHGHDDILPLAKYLDSPYFPTIIDRSSNPNVYNVGPLETPITANSSSLISINEPGWSQLQTKDGRYTQSVVAENNSARLYVSTLNFTKITITYLDDGNDFLSVNIYSPVSNGWIYDYGIIEKGNTGEWKNYEMVVQPNERGFVVLGLHAYTENFTISKINAEPCQPQVKNSVGSQNIKLASATCTPTPTDFLTLNTVEKNRESDQKG